MRMANVNGNGAVKIFMWESRVARGGNMYASKDRRGKACKDF